ncbi:MAG TPA: hypothetical protein VKB80_28290, partial [Kofleriaceae bacterium]|nr:hypothetical protein [Kofleriaceae bacterium]
EAPIPPLAAAAPGVAISSELESVVRQALAKSRAERFTTAGAFLDAIEATPEAEGSQVVNLRPGGRRGRMMAAVGAALVLSAGSAAAVFWLLNRDGEGAPGAGARAAREVAPPAAAPLPVEDADTAPASAPPAAEQPPAEPATAAAPAPSPPAAALPEEPDDVARARARAAQGETRSAVRTLEKLRSRNPRRPEVYYALGNLYAELNAWRPSVEAYGSALELAPVYRGDQRLISDVVEALASDLAHVQAARIIRKQLGAAALPRLEQAMRSASPRQRVRAKRLRARIAPR